MKDVREVTWDELEMLVIRLSCQIPKGEYNYIYGIPRGGLIPAVILSHRLDIPMTSSLDELEGETLKILLVDDICDTGNTIKKYHGYDTATIYFKPEVSKYEPTYNAETVRKDTWIMFPYETQLNDMVSQVNYSFG